MAGDQICRVLLKPEKTEIADIFQQYLDRYCGGGNAIANIREFYGDEEFEDLILNPGNDQRVIFIAANFRKEVTATVLWLLGHGIKVQCFGVVPLTYNEELFLDLRQIIPTPEAEDFMIGMATKETEEKSTQGTQRKSHRLRLEFWELALERLRSQGLTRYQNIGPTKDHWLSCGTGVSGFVYNLIFGKTEIRVELSLQRPSAEENKWAFDELISQRAQLEQKFGTSLEWKRLDNRISSRIEFSLPVDGYNRANWPEMIDWLSQHIGQLEETFKEALSALNQRIKNGEPIA